MNNYFTIFKNVITKGDYDLSVLLARIDKYHIEGKITDEERDELITMAREGASAVGGIDVIAKLEELDLRIKNIEDGNVPVTPGETYEEYVPGKWYYGGDKCAFGGNNYICTAPEGVVCVWSPVEYPAYWQRM
jgi:hypothetical protein